MKTRQNLHRNSSLPHFFLSYPIVFHQQTIKYDTQCTGLTEDSMWDILLIHFSVNRLDSESDGSSNELSVAFLCECHHKFSQKKKKDFRLYFDFGSIYQNKRKTCYNVQDVIHKKVMRKTNSRYCWFLNLKCHNIGKGSIFHIFILNTV